MNLISITSLYLQLSTVIWNSLVLCNWVRLGNCCWFSPAWRFLVSSLLRTHGLIYVHPKTVYVFWYGPSSSIWVGFLLLLVPRHLLGKWLCWPSSAQSFLVLSPHKTHEHTLLSDSLDLVHLLICPYGRMLMQKCLRWLLTCSWWYAFIMTFPSNGHLCNISLISLFQGLWISGIPFILSCLF
jgi:hypothetical protein